MKSWEKFGINLTKGFILLEIIFIKHVGWILPVPSKFFEVVSNLATNETDFVFEAN